MTRLVITVSDWSPDGGRGLARDTRARRALGEAGQPLHRLAAWLGSRHWLDGVFSAGDLMMAPVLLRFRPAGIFDAFPTLAAYVARGEARTAYRRAFNDRSGA